MIVTSSYKDVKFTVNTDKCCGCKKCVRRCQENVWVWDKEQNCSIPKYPDDCVMCFQCELDCLNNCFTVEPLVILKQDPLQSKPLF